MKALFSETERKAELLERFIIEFHRVRNELKAVRAPEVIQEIYLKALLRLFDAKCMIILSGADNGTARAVKVYNYSGAAEEGFVNIRDGEVISGASVGELSGYGRHGSTVSRSVDKDDPLFTKGVRSFFSFPYSYRGEKCVLMICNFAVGDYRDSIESYESRLAAIVMELLDATFFDEHMAELSAALAEAKNNGSRAELYMASKKAIEFYAKYEYPISDKIVADYLDTTLSRLTNPGRQAFPVEVHSELIKHLKETIKHAGGHDSADSLMKSLFPCFGPCIGQSVPGERIAEHMPLTTFSLSRVMMALSLKLQEEDLIEKCRAMAQRLHRSTPNPFIVKMQGITNPHDSEYIACLQSRWMEIASLCEGIRLQVLSADPDAERLHKLLKDIAPDTRSLLWTALSFVSDNNYKEQKNADMPQEGVNIESLWLKTWFGHHILEGETLDMIFSDCMRSRLSRISFCHELSVFVLYLLHRLKTIESKAPVIFPYGSEGAARALFYLMAEYGHSVCRLPRSVRLYEYINNAWETEGVLYFSRMPHRDHIFHSIDVALLGLLLLHTRSNGNDSISLIDQMAPQFDNEKSLVLANWLLAALFHDIGYSFVLYETSAKLVDFFETPSLREGSAVIADAVNEAKRKILEDVKNRFPDMWAGTDLPDKINHGLVSAAHLDYILRGRPHADSLHEKYRAAVHAIIMHDSKSSPVLCSEAPLSFLLLLCDHLQDWSRPRVDTSRMRKGVAASLDYRQPFEVDAYHNMAYLTLNLKIGTDRIRYADDTLKFVLVYRKPDNGNYDPVLLWLSTTYDLQRAAGSTLWEQIEFSIEVLNSDSQLEIDYARDFVLQEKNGNLIANWLDAVTGGGSFVRHGKTGCGERLTIEISNRHAALIDDLRTDEFYSSYTRWKRKLTDRVSLGRLRFLCDLDDK
ncbi:MAG: hypothetical protein HZC49_11470 [Nitrospirae bacterium]|nr:hypothetical protein [Nitrospirota bacterium]